MFSVFIHNDRVESSDLVRMPFFQHETVTFLFLGLDRVHDVFFPWAGTGGRGGLLARVRDRKKGFPVSNMPLPSRNTILWGPFYGG